MKEPNKNGEQNSNKINEILNAVKQNEPNFSFYNIDPLDIKFYPESFKMCEMNSCGCFNSNWTCPPASPDAHELFFLIKRYKNAAVFTLKYKLADAYDWKSIELALSNFSKLCKTINNDLQKNRLDTLVFGSGACTLCAECTYPNKLCRFPDKIIYPLEAAGIDACSLKKSGEIEDPDAGKREYIGLIAYN